MGLETERDCPPAQRQARADLTTTSDPVRAVPPLPHVKEIRMSYKSREKRRRARLAIERTRSERRETMRGRHYLCVVSRDGCCNECGTSLRIGADAVYRHTPREIFCLNCSSQLALKPRPSLAWERKEQRKRKKRRAGFLATYLASLEEGSK